MRASVWLAALAACTFNSSSGVEGTEGGSSTGLPPATSVPRPPGSSGTVSSSTAGTTETGDSSESSGGGSTGEPPPGIGPFGEPMLVPGLNTAFPDDDPSLRRDMLEIYFGSSRNGTDEDVYRSERATLDGPWSDPQPVVLLNSAEDDTTPELSHDGLTIVLASERESSQTDLYASTRPSVDSLDWSVPQPVAGLNSDRSEWGLNFQGDLLVGYFCRWDGDAEENIFRAVRGAPGGAFSEVQPVDALNSNGPDCSPWIDAAGEYIAFDTREFSGGGRELGWSVREGGDFMEPVRIEGVNTDADESDPWLSPNRATIYFAREHEDTGDKDIFVAYAE